MDKNTILETSEQLFFGKKQADVKLSSVARSLHIQTPSLYHWFADKQSLLEEVIHFSAKKFLASLSEILEENDPKKTILWYLTFPSETKNLF
jgi:AcrR family transcriptional regulator